MKKLFFVYNPHAGKGMISTKLAEIINIFTKSGYIVTVYPTQRALDAYDKVCAADGMYDVIVCGGGDGTLSEVISALMTHKSPQPYLGYIPAGTTNDFANTLGIPKQSVKAAKKVVEGTPISYDIGKMNGRFFNYIAAFGLFTEVSYKTPQNMKNVLGHQAYVLESLRSLNNIVAYNMTVKFNDIEVKGDFIYGMVANSDSVGGFKGITGKNIEVNDGLFEVALVKEPLNALELQQVVAGLFSKNQESPMVLRFKTNHVIFESRNPIEWTTDGEYGDAHERVDISVVNNAIQILS